MVYTSLRQLFKLSPTIVRLTSDKGQKIGSSRISYCLWNANRSALGPQFYRASTKIEERNFTVFSRERSCSLIPKSTQPAVTPEVACHLRETRNIYTCFTRHNKFSTTTNIMADQKEFTVNHDTGNNLFYIDLEIQGSSDANIKAKLDYDWINPSHVDLYHTEVPPELQGKGIAQHLAKAAFDYFSDKSILMRPSCTYLQRYLKRNPLPIYLNHVEAAFK